ncbi:MAG TPA: beta-N-acetylhexosaminidase [Gemmatimonadaceae bacterium]|nr:beta-N-acetylhexosaminidase [Gemmatimonadaceae bacterium]
MIETSPATRPRLVGGLRGLALTGAAAALAACARPGPARVAAVPTGPVAVSRDSISIIPRPASLTRLAGSFTVDEATVITSDRASVAVARQLARDLEPATGLAIPVRLDAPAGFHTISFVNDPSLLTKLGTEGYRLEVRSGTVVVTAAEPAGSFYAVETIRQLLPPAVFRAAPVADVRWTMPAVVIEDTPRFAWRGAHLDVARHFMPKEFVEKFIDLLALQKMNTFHWHLTDDQGWRIEIKKYPRLTEVGAWRTQTVVGRPSRDTSDAAFDHKPTGGFYTQDDIREIVAYAKERFINVVPEIEMPGHEQAAVAAYPSLGNFGDTLPVWTTWGVSKHILNPSDTTIAFMEDVLTEVMSLFPSRYIHVGGDEAAKDEWKVSPRAQALIKEYGLANEDQLQGWFMKQIDAFLDAHGRTLVGWDEILDGGLSPHAVVMAWQGADRGVMAARLGHDVVMTPGGQTYLDKYQVSPNTGEPIAQPGTVTLEQVYHYDPLVIPGRPARRTTPAVPEYSIADSAFAVHILGSQAQFWTEYMPDPKQVEYMAFPRLCAMAEVLWTPAALTNYEDFTQRLAPELERMHALDVNYRGTGGR